MANSTRKCKRCAEYKPAESGVKVPAGWFCCHAHTIEFAREKSAKATARQIAMAKVVDKQAEIAKAASHRKRKLEVKPLSYWMKRAQAAVNAYIRARDAGQPCISCGRPDDGSHQRHASHYRSVGGHPELRFCEINIWASCSVCNNWLSGNLVPYREALIAKIGIDKVEWLEGPHEPKRYRREDYQEIEAEYKEKLKELKSNDNGGCDD